MDPLQVTVFIIGTVIIVFGAYYVTYFIGSKASGRAKGRTKNRNINILDRFAISKDKSFCIVEIAGKVYIVGITNQSMTVIDTLDAMEYTEAAAQREDPGAWRAADDRFGSGGFTSKFLYFLSANIRKRFKKGASANAGSGTFAESMEAAREKDITGQDDEKGKS